MSYEADPAGLGVGKHFGRRYSGNVVGRVGGVDSIESVVIQIKAGDIASVEAALNKVPAYSTVKEVYLEVEEAFAATSTADVTLDGNTILTAAANIAAVGAGYQTLTGTTANLTSPATVSDLKVNVSAAGETSSTGKAKLTVRYVR